MPTFDRNNAPLSPQSRAEAWKQLQDEQFDVVIVGGGSVGVGAALDAATRGLKVAMVEARDYAAGTSSRSSKMFHGGLRYLAMLDFRLVAESLEERELSMSKLAPHLVKPLRFLFPLTKRFIERPYMAAGFMLYDTMGGAKSVPRQKHYGRKGTLKQIPSLKTDALVGSVRYFDTLVDDARHTMTVARTAAQYGATIRTSTQVTDVIKEAGRVIGVTVRDAETGETAEVRGKVVLNATGVWTGELQKLAGVRHPKFTVRASKGVHIVVPKAVIDSTAALTFVTEKSVLFVIPFGEYWIIGTTDTDWDLDLAHPAATKADIDYILDHVNDKLKTPITYDDITGVYAGLRPLVAGNSDSTSNLSRNHAVAVDAPGLVSVAGGKYTTYRVIGKDAIDLAAKEANVRVPESVTKDVPLMGANGYHGLNNQIPAVVERLGLPEYRIRHLIDRYGSLMFEVLEAAGNEETKDLDLLRPLTGADEYLRAEALYAVTHEGALHLEDVLARRTRISIEYAHRGVDCAREVAELIAGPLGWDTKTLEYEIEKYTERVDAERKANAALTDAEADKLRTVAPEARGEIIEPVVSTS